MNPQALAEFIGTFLFLFIAFGVANSASQGSIIASGQGGNTTANGGLDPSALLLSSLGFGFSLATQAWAFFRVSGGLFNRESPVEARGCRGGTDGTRRQPPSPSRSS
jgi:glycerol uptake facilitator-like aquaporin